MSKAKGTPDRTEEEWARTRKDWDELYQAEAGEGPVSDEEWVKIRKQIRDMELNPPFEQPKPMDKKAAEEKPDMSWVGKLANVGTMVSYYNNISGVKPSAGYGNLDTGMKEAPKSAVPKPTEIKAYKPEPLKPPEPVTEPPPELEEPKEPAMPKTAADSKAIPLTGQDLALELTGYTSPQQREQLVLDLLAEKKKKADQDSAKYIKALESEYKSQDNSKELKLPSLAFTGLGGVAGAAGGAGLGAYIAGPKRRQTGALIGGAAGALAGAVATAGIALVLKNRG